MEANGTKSLGHHLREVRDGKRRFENAYQGVARMILNEPAAIEKVLVNGRTTFDFRIFRISEKHVVGMYDEVNSFVSFIKDAAEGGSSREMAFVLVGEPGNGKTFFVDNLCALYRQFLAMSGKPKIYLQLCAPGQTRGLRQDRDHPVADLRRSGDPGHEPVRVPR